MLIALWDPRLLSQMFQMEIDVVMNLNRTEIFYLFEVIDGYSLAKLN